MLLTRSTFEARLMARKKKAQTERIAPGCYIRSVGGVWQIRWYDRARNPKQKQYTLSTEDKGYAVELARDMLRRKQMGLYDPWKSADREMTFEEGLRLFGRDRKGHVRDRSIENYHRFVAQFAETLRLGLRSTLRSVDADAIKAWVYRPDLARASQRTAWRHLRVFFGWAEKAGHVDRNPVLDVPSPKASKSKTKYLTDQQIDALLTFIEEWHASNGDGFIHEKQPNDLWARDAFELLACTGMRLSEVARLKWMDVLWPETQPGGVGFVRVSSTKDGRTKNDDDRLVTMIPRTERLLRRLQGETRRTSTPEEHVLKAGDGRSPISPPYLSKRFRYYRRKAGLPEVPLHGLRHSYAVELLSRGANVVQVKDELGHRDIGTTMGYLQIVPLDRARSTLKLFEEKPEEASTIVDEEAPETARFGYSLDPPDE